MKLRIYIVDDEQMAIEYLIYLLKRVNVEYEIVGSSTNSIKALKEIQRCKPDIVFADITMPVMDGLELSEQILKKVSTRVFLLTSYRDFDFVKRGMQIGITDYILKNDLNEEVLQDLLEKTRKSLEVEWKKNYLILEYNVRRFLLSASSVVEDHVYEHKPMQRYGLISVWGKPKICVKHQHIFEHYQVDCYDLYRLSYPNGIQCSAFTEMPNGELCGIFFVNSDVSDGQKLLWEASEVLITYYAEKGMNVRCMISDTMHHFLELQDCYQEQLLLSERLYAYPSMEIIRTEFLREKKPQKYIQDIWMGKLSTYLENDDFSQAEEFIGELLDVWKESLAIWEFTDNLKNIYRCLKSYVIRYQANMDMMYIPEFFSDIADIKENLNDCIHELERIKTKEQTEGLSLYIQQAISYIKNHYGRDISIPDIAEFVGISEGHLRRLFKQELNIKVLDYLTEYRLECAKILMKNKEDSLSEIWKKTGFTSAQYFSYVFKRKEGILPKDYMKQVRND